MVKKLEEKNEVGEATEMCGHVNKQFVSIDGQLEDLLCTLSNGHDGDHSAPAKCLRLIEGLKDPRKEIVIRGGKEFYIVEEVGVWSDAAGKTSFEIADEMEEKRMKLAEYITNNPSDNEGKKRVMRELGLIPTGR